MATLALASAFVSGPLVVSLMGVQWSLDLAVRPQLLEWHQVSRIALNPIAWTDQMSVGLGCMCLYHFRVVETMLGTRKYVRLVLKSWIASMAAVPVILLALSTVSINVVSPPGPTALIGSLCSVYYYLVPSIYQFSVEGIGSVSDKALVYLTVMMFLRRPGDLIKFGVGWAAGLLFGRQ